MITLYFLNASRCIRIAWLLEELGVEWDVIRSERGPNGLSPPDFKSQIPSALGKAPTIKDSQTGAVVTESGAIIEYLCQRFPEQSARLFPTDLVARAEVLEWLHGAEGTFAVHGMALLYARWTIAEEAKHTMPGMEERLSRNIVNDFNWLEGQLQKQQAEGRDWIVGDGLTVADIQMQFTIDFMLERKIGNKGHGEGKWPAVEAWLKRTKEVEAYKRAVSKTGHTLHGNFKQ